MNDLLEPAQDALFAKLMVLEGAEGMPAGLAVLQHIPQDTQPPYVAIGQLSSENAEDKGELLEEITAEIHYVYRGAARYPLLAMMRSGRGLLQNQEIAADGAEFERPRWITADASTALADGVTYVGLQVFKFYAEPA
jgi:hypothetical protein